MKKMQIMTLAAAFILTLSLAAADMAQARGRNTTVTGPGGNSASRNVSRGFTESGYQRNVSTTGPAGRSGTRSTNWSR